MVFREVEAHNNKTIESLLNQQRVMKKEESIIRRMLPNKAKISAKKGREPETVDLATINETFVNIFSFPRNSDFNSKLKEKARNAIVKKFQDFNLQTFTQEFKSSSYGDVIKGVNVIGIREGLHRGKVGDEILLIGAHYDTVSTSTGIDDNASGVVAMLEIARVLRFRKKPLNHTILFVAFDLEELGLWGSIAFIREYLLPKEIQRGVKFIGSYILDMVLNYDTSVNSQTLPNDFVLAIPGITTKLKSNKNRGDFISVWTRKNVDTPLFTALSNAWTQSNKSSKYKLIEFRAPLPSKNPSPNDLYRYGTFTRSDHASFWYHDVHSYADTLRAVLLTDMGPWRGVNMRCYHNWCDDKRRLTKQNLDFLKHTIQVMLTVLTDYPPNSIPKRRTTKRTTKKPLRRRRID
ncbi:uncharacterized protein B4U80_11618 [Leptotrombidium deliense]|uniref:Peptidase M28 domain-containing protein n=1 Tax=Leptotrombidium deliense TaxID=299467 RepID=A0A443SP66_9ACAR|nr:uncharacterized protein B4U80_11618 [Leptotrombidium deliense]